MHGKVKPFRKLNSIFGFLLHTQALHKECPLWTNSWTYNPVQHVISPIKFCFWKVFEVLFEFFRHTVCIGDWFGQVKLDNGVLVFRLERISANEQATSNTLSILKVFKIGLKITNDLQHDVPIESFRVVSYT